MKKSLFLLPIALFALVGCGEPAKTEKTAVLNAKNVLGYTGSANVEYGDSAAAVTVDGVTASWVGIGCYGQNSDTQEWDQDGWFQMRKKSSSVLKLSVEGDIKSVTLTLATRKSNFDATKPLSIGFGKTATTEEVKTVDFVKDTADVAVPLTMTDAKLCDIAYDLNDGYSYTVYIDHVTVVYMA